MQVGGIFCDSAKEFDCLNHKIMLIELHFYGIQESAENWFRAYLADKKTKG
jgi:hypothetical protein